jgi:hypothetical protein
MRPRQITKNDGALLPCDSLSGRGGGDGSNGSSLTKPRAETISERRSTVGGLTCLSVNRKSRRFDRAAPEAGGHAGARAAAGAVTLWLGEGVRRWRAEKKFVKRGVA